MTIKNEQCDDSIPFCTFLSQAAGQMEQLNRWRVHLEVEREGEDHGPEEEVNRGVATGMEVEGVKSKIPLTIPPSPLYPLSSLRVRLQAEGLPMLPEVVRDKGQEEDKPPNKKELHPEIILKDAEGTAKVGEPRVLFMILARKVSFSGRIRPRVRDI